MRKEKWPARWTEPTTAFCAHFQFNHQHKQARSHSCTPLYTVLDGCIGTLWDDAVGRDKETRARRAERQQGHCTLSGMD
jgi:hypothetical protein